MLMSSLLAGFVAQWGKFTTKPYQNVEIPDGNHYIVSTHYLEVTKVHNCPWLSHSQTAVSIINNWLN